MLKYTGHPIVDVGVAVIVAFARKRKVATVTPDDLDKVAAYIEQQYVVNPLKSFLNVAFPDSGFTQPAYEKAPHKRIEYARLVSRGYCPDDPQGEERCVFTGFPSTDIKLTKKGKPGRAFRQHIPLLTGEGVINFHPGGDAGLPVSGIALLCIQAFPLGCAKCGGRLLAVHSDNEDITYEFAKNFLERNRLAINLAQQSGSKKMPEAKRSAKTLLIETFLEVEQRRGDAAEEHAPSSVTAYHLSNSGQSNSLDRNSPPLTIYYFPLEMTEFVSYAAYSPEYRDAWQRLTQRAWQLAKPKRKRKGGAEEQVADNYEPRRNFLYEDLFKLPEDAAFFIQRYFLRIPQRYGGEDDPRRAYRTKDELHLISWNLTEFFMERVMGMNKERIRQVRELGDKLAVYVDAQNEKRFFRNFFVEQNYGNFRSNLIKANINYIKKGNPPLITLDPYIEIFEDGEEIERSNWRLARDLVLIRMIEELYNRGWLGKNQDVIPDTQEENVNEI